MALFGSKRVVSSALQPLPVYPETARIAASQRTAASGQFRSYALAAEAVVFFDPGRATFMNDACALGCEGIVSKRLGSRIGPIRSSA
jgi:hypothetical protein